MANATGGTITTSGGRTIHTFNSSADFVVPAGGGGTGGDTGAAPTAGTANTGGGGGGGYNVDGANGGSGVVIISYVTDSLGATPVPVMMASYRRRRAG